MLDYRLRLLKCRIQKRTYNQVNISDPLKGWKQKVIYEQHHCEKKTALGPALTFHHVFRQFSLCPEVMRAMSET